MLCIRIWLLQLWNYWFCYWDILTCSQGHRMTDSPQLLALWTPAQTQTQTRRAEEAFPVYYFICAFKSSSLVLQNTYMHASVSTHISLSIIQRELSKPWENMIRWIQRHLSVNKEKTCCLIRRSNETDVFNPEVFLLSWMMTDLKKWAKRWQCFVFSICITIPDLSLTFNRDHKFLISP